MILLFYLINFLFSAYTIVLVVRAIASWISMVSPHIFYEVKILGKIVQISHLLTEPPLRLLSRYIPPLQFGGIGIDLSYIVLFMLVLVAQRFANQLFFWLLV